MVFNMRNFYENPEIQSLNRLPMRSPLFPYPEEELAVKDICAGPEGLDFTRSSYVKLLDGEWDFTLLNNPHDDEKEDFSKARWTKIKVPGTWTLQGFDKPHYTNVQMPFDTVPPFVPEENPTGIYKLKVSIPSEWKNRRIILHIGSAESCTQVFVDGKEAAVSKDTRLPFETDITSFVKGKDSVEITIKVIRYSDGSFIEDQDQWWFGGIHRSVYLYSTDEVYIEDIEALSKIEKGCGLIPLNVTLSYGSEADKENRFLNSELDSKEFEIRYTVYKIEGSCGKGIPGQVCSSGSAKAFLNLRANLNQIRTKILIKNPDVWSHENPALYAVSVSLYDNQGRFIESTAFTTGFKTVEIKDRMLLVNGKKVYIKGVNRHEHSQLHGKTLSTEEMVHDLHLLKSYNFNAVRTCHYPDDERWYELCNRYGIYVLDEANIENHAYYDVMARSDDWTNAYLQRIQRMVRRDKNNVCIFGWSLGNESGDGQNQVAAQAWIRRVDKTRIVHYEGFVRPEFTQGDFSLDSLARGKGLTDLISPMYPSIDLITQYAKTRDDYRPIIMCEYSHAMGNANGSLADYWRAIYSTPGLQGGFIWDWIDQGLYAQEEKGKAGEPQGGSYWKYGGDFGDKPSDYDFCLNGILFPDQTPKPAMEECKQIFSPLVFRTVNSEQGLFEIQSRYDFIPANNLLLNWKILKNGNVIKFGNYKISNLYPEEKNCIQIPCGEYVSKRDGFYILIAEISYMEKMPFADKGWTFYSQEVILNPAVSKADSNWLFGESHKKADFEEVKKIAENFKPQIFRPLTENECVKRELPNMGKVPLPFAFAGKPTKMWLDAGLDKCLEKKISDSEIIIFTGEGSAVTGQLARIQYSFKEDKSPLSSPALKMDVEIELSNLLSEYPAAGIELKIPAKYSQIEWYGRGPHENYSDRKDSSLLGLYRKNADEMEVPYIVPQENGSRTDTSYLCLSDKENQCQLHIQSLNPFTFSYSKYSVDNIWKAEHHNELIDLSRLENDGHYLLHINAALRGTGTGACGPDTLDEYRIKAGRYKLSLLFW